MRLTNPMAAAMVVLVLLAFGLTGPGWRPGAVATAQAPRADDVQVRLKKRMLELARKGYEADLQRLNVGQLANFGDRLTHWSLRWLDAQRDLADSDAARQAAYSDHLARMQTLHRIVDKYAKTGVGSVSDVMAADYYRVQAELLLEQAKAKKGR